MAASGSGAEGHSFANRAGTCPSWLPCVGGCAVKKTGGCTRVSPGVSGESLMCGSGGVKLVVQDSYSPRPAGMSILMRSLETVQVTDIGPICCLFVCADTGQAFPKQLKAVVGDRPLYARTTSRALLSSGEPPRGSASRHVTRRTARRISSNGIRPHPLETPGLERQCAGSSL
jgi:hypothetical protein